MSTNFTAVSRSVYLSTKIVNNLPIFPVVTNSILETIYRFCRDDITRQIIPHINNSISEIVFTQIISCPNFLYVADQIISAYVVSCIN